MILIRQKMRYFSSVAVLIIFLQIAQRMIVDDITFSWRNNCCILGYREIKQIKVD